MADLLTTEQNAIVLACTTIVLARVDVANVLATVVRRNADIQNGLNNAFAKERSTGYAMLSLPELAASVK